MHTPWRASVLLMLRHGPPRPVWLGKRRTCVVLAEQYFSSFFFLWTNASYLRFSFRSLEIFSRVKGMRVHFKHVSVPLSSQAFPRGADQLLECVWGVCYKLAEQAVGWSQLLRVMKPFKSEWIFYANLSIRTLTGGVTHTRAHGLKHKVCLIIG